MKRTWHVLLLLLLLAVPASLKAQFTYATNNGAITLVSYTKNDAAVVISNFVTTIGKSAFANCYSLASVTIPGSVASIGEAAFFNCIALTNITIGNSVTNIGANAFAGDLSDVESGDPLASVIIPNSVTSIGEAAFSQCYSLTNVTLGTGVTSIGGQAFEFTSLSSITIPNRVASIGDYAFGWTGLASVTIPNNVTNIGYDNYAFYGCASLTAISVNAGNPAYSSVAGVLFNKSKTQLIQYPPGKAGISYTIPNSVTNIGNSAFYDCANLASVTIDNSVTCIGYDAFLGCARLGSVAMGNGVTSIEAEAFGGCSSLGAIAIGANVTNIGYGGFSDCSSLASVCFEGNAPSTDPSAFLSDNMARVYYLPNTTGWSSPFAGLPAVQTNFIVFTGNATIGPVPLTVSFTAPGVDGAGNPISRWNWSFGDGSTSTAQNPSHTYTNSGAFSPSLIATNNAGATVAGIGPASITVTTPARPGIAGFSLSGANLVLNGIYGQSGGTYYALTATNLALPLSQWTRVATNVLSASGSFTITASNTVTRSVPQRFYLLQTQ